jgi:hypothetical protein
MVIYLWTLHAEKIQPIKFLQSYCTLYCYVNANNDLANINNHFQLIGHILTLRLLSSCHITIIEDQ